MISGLTGSSPPGTHYENATIPLGGWVTADYKHSLQLAPGKHTIRAAKYANFGVLQLTPVPSTGPGTASASNPATATSPAVPSNVAFSNPVTIEILP